MNTFFSADEEEVLHQSDDYGFFCDIENIEPDEMIEYSVVYSIRSDYYHVCRKVTRKTENIQMTNTPTTFSKFSPNPKSTQPLQRVIRPHTPTKKSPDYIFPELNPSISIGRRLDRNGNTQNPYSQEDVIFSKKCYYYIYCILIIAVITVTLILEL